MLKPRLRGTGHQEDVRKANPMLTDLKNACAIRINRCFGPVFPVIAINKLGNFLAIGGRSED
jgi:hypothetical protein